IVAERERIVALRTFIGDASDFREIGFGADSDLGGHGGGVFGVGVFAENQASALDSAASQRAAASRQGAKSSGFGSIVSSTARPAKASAGVAKIPAPSPAPRAAPAAPSVHTSSIGTPSVAASVSRN